jgi:DNA-binding cell septation regulator SpoVG
VTEHPLITDLRYTPAGPHDAATGLLGFVALTLPGGLRVDGLTLRRSREGRRYLAFPSRLDREGREHPYLRPLNNSSRQVIERAVLSALANQGVLP